MTEAGISVGELNHVSKISTATIGRARRGMFLQRKTAVKIFDALVKHDRCQFLRELRSQLMVDSLDAEASPELVTKVIAGFNS